MNQVIETIRQRRSIRRYKQEPIDEEILNQMLEAGTYAPTSMGRQSPFIVAVKDPKLRKQLVKMNATVMGSFDDPYYGAPVIVLVFAPKNAPNPVYDGTLVLGTMMLAAKSLGLDSCWIHREREMFESEEGKELMQTLQLPEGLMGIGALALGYADAPPSPEKPRKEGYVRVV